jgi:hypothetical protein
MRTSESAAASELALTLRQVADTELSLTSRLGYVALLLSALVVTAGISSLWLTEPALPLRTHVAFALMVVIGLAWVTFAARVLTTRRLLLARHHIIAGRMAVTFTSVYLLGSLVLAYFQGSVGARASAGMGAVMVVAAIGVLIRAHRRFNSLLQRRDALARQLGR